VVERKGEGTEIETAPGTTREDALRLLQEVLASNVELLKMGIPAREIRALVQAADSNFKETEFGFSEFAELLNLAGDKGLVRIEADPHHGFRYYPGAELPHAVAAALARTAAAEVKEATPAPTPAPLAEASRGRGRRRRRKRSDVPAAAVSQSGEADDPEAPLAAEASEGAESGEPDEVDDPHEETDPDAGNELDDVNGNVLSDQPAARRPSRRRRAPRRAPAKAAPEPPGTAE
jgi:hypothetical protein